MVCAVASMAGLPVKDYNRRANRLRNLVNGRACQQRVPPVLEGVQPASYG